MHRLAEALHLHRHQPEHPHLPPPNPRGRRLRSHETQRHPPQHLPWPLKSQHRRTPEGNPPGLRGAPANHRFLLAEVGLPCPGRRFPEISRCVGIPERSAHEQGHVPRGAEHRHRTLEARTGELHLKYLQASEQLPLNPGRHRAGPQGIPGRPEAHRVPRVGLGEGQAGAGGRRVRPE